MSAVVEQGDATYVFERDRIAIVRGGAIATVIPAPREANRWRDATSIPALDGEGRWVVAVRGGALWRVMLDGEVERIDDRFGLGTATLHAISSAGSTVALALADGTAVSTDGVHLARYPIAGALAVAPRRLAIATDRAIELWDLARGTSISFAIARARPAFLGTQLVAITDHEIWLETDGKLAPLRVPATMTSAAVAGDRLWVADDTALYVRDHGAFVKTSAHVDHAHLFGAPNGDVWLAAADLARYSFATPAIDVTWKAHVAPVFQRVCAHCHLPGGSADLDLSTQAAWTAEHDEIVRRVVVTRTMPPTGTTLDEPDRRALEGWLGVQSK